MNWRHKICKLTTTSKTPRGQAILPNLSLQASMSHSDGSRRPYVAVVFDLGGVVLTSPFQAIAAYERQVGVAPGAINRLIRGSGERGGFQRLERGELEASEFEAVFTEEAAAAGLKGVNGVDFLACISSIRTRPLMVQAIQALKSKGYTTGVLTNNFHDSRVGSSFPDQGKEFKDVMRSVDVVVESCKVGMRKPDRRIYEFTCDRLQAAPEGVVYLDDIGANLKAPAEMGIRTIKVALDDTTGEAAVRTLEGILNEKLISKSHHNLASSTLVKSKL